MASNCIELRGIRVHNLQNVDLDIPLNQLTVIVGVSGSGKSSLAFDTLYAEGQRRYIDSFSSYAKQFLDRLQRPDADRIDRIPPAIAIKQSASGGTKNGRSTVATETEIYDYMRLLFAKVGKVVCENCNQIVEKDSPDSALNSISELTDGTRFQIAFPFQTESQQTESQTETDSIPISEAIATLQDDGFTRLIVNGATVSLNDYSPVESDDISFVVVDRLKAGQSAPERTADSLETAFRFGRGHIALLISSEDGDLQIDKKPWVSKTFADRLICSSCGTQFTEPDHRLFSFNSKLGACEECNGTGQNETMTFERVVPDASKSLADGAIAAWTTPAYRHELDELLALADDYNIPIDVPFSNLNQQQRRLIFEGVPERNFGGLRGFFNWLQRNRYKIGVGVFLSRWRTYIHCESCEGSRLNHAARAVKINGQHIGQLASSTIEVAKESLTTAVANLTPSQRLIAATVVEEIHARLNYLADVGLNYIALDRRMHTLSGGERQRVSLTAALGSSLVNTLYVLDEPSAGLHPSDSDRILQAIVRLRNAGNTVVVVEHEEAFFSEADHVVEIGPAAGRSGGRIVFTGTPSQLTSSPDSVTGTWLTEKSRSGKPAAQIRSPTNFLQLTGVRHHNLRDVDVRIPLGVLCVVTGVSGSGKSSLIHETLFPAVCLQTGSSHQLETVGTYKELIGCENISGAVMVDQRPIGRSSRSNPITYMKAFDDIRKIFAVTAESKLRNFTPSTFSFNSKTGGRCPKCQGAGQVTIDMQFLADLSMVCPECNGHRYRAEVLEAKYRSQSISDVLNMTVDEAFTFFRGHARLQKRLQVLRDVGLGYLPLGQPATTLSGGESQRLKIAAYMAGVATIETSEGKSNSAGALFLLDEPTNGLHGLDVQNLLKSLDALVAIGHSLIVIEHHIDVIRHADYIIDLGPGAGTDGGTIVATGTPAEIEANASSITGQELGSIT